MYLSGLTPQQMNAYDDYKLKDVGIGFTNIVQRTSRSSADLSRYVAILMLKLHHHIVFSALTVLVACQEEHPATATPSSLATLKSRLV